MNVHIDSPRTGGPSCLVGGLILMGFVWLVFCWPLAPVTWFLAGGLAWVEGQSS